MTQATNNVLAGVAMALATGRIRVVDLTQTLTPEFPQIALPPEMGQCWPFRIEEVSHYDERGPGWYWNNFSCGEHTGTHFDAPIHWVSGKDLPNNSVDTIQPDRFIGPAFVVDCSKESAANPDFLLTKPFLLDWEKKHGKISPRSWVLMRTDWSKRTTAEAFLNMKEDGAHVPGPHPELLPFLVRERDVVGWGSEGVGTDAGQAFRFDPPFPCHNGMHGSNKFGLASLANLSLLPPTGAILITPPLKIVNGSGSPCRVLALVAGT
jgi:kynurenine formamidase